MTPLRTFALAGALLIAFANSSAASAHASLQHCSITNYQVFAVSKAPRQVTATFAEQLDPAPAQTWMAVFEGQADHGLVTEKQHSVVSYRNPKLMTLQLPRLVKEKYYLIWHTKSSVDGHFAAGIVYFQVK